MNIYILTHSISLLKNEQLKIELYHSKNNVVQYSNLWRLSNIYEQQKFPLNQAEKNILQPI
jgi:hypothetical protein